MKAPVVWVTASLTAAIVVTLTFLIATTGRGETIASRPYDGSTYVAPDITRPME